MMTWLDAKSAAEALGIDRSTLLNMVSRSRPTLPGHPLQVGSKGRAYYRFRSDLITGWAQLVRDARNTASAPGGKLPLATDQQPVQVRTPSYPTPRPRARLRARLRAQG